MNEILKRMAAAIVCVMMLMSTSAVSLASDYTVEDAYYECCTLYPEFIEKLINDDKYPVTNEQIISFLTTVKDNLMVYKNDITEENFDGYFQNAALSAANKQKHIQVRSSIAHAYPGAIVDAQEGIMSPEFEPIYKTVKAIIFEHNMLDLPTEEQTEETSEEKTEAPTETPTEAPTETPTEAPTEAPTETPTEAPTDAPTETPTKRPGNGNGGGSGNVTHQPEDVTENTTEGPTAPVEKPTAPVKKFNDMQNAQWAEESVYKLAEMGIISGYGDGTFKPHNKITRAEFSKIIVLVSGLYKKDAKCSFTDVKESDWFYSYVASARELGYINGRGDGTFDPNANITRADLCVIVYRYIKAIDPEFGKNAAVVTFADKDKIPSYAAEAVNAIVGAGIAGGMEQNKFEPLLPATRAQSAKIVYGAIKAALK